MISREPTLERLTIAQNLLLTPFGLDESHLTQALSAIRAHQVDDADLYFQYTRSEGWSLEEGIVKTGSFRVYVLGLFKEILDLIMWWYGKAV